MESIYFENRKKVKLELGKSYVATHNICDRHFRTLAYRKDVVVITHISDTTVQFVIPMENINRIYIVGKGDFISSVIPKEVNYEKFNQTKNSI